MNEELASFGEQYLSESFHPPITHDKVECLALEGGGGKGNAYVGALYGLDQLGVLNKLKTVAGSSAGAITALALSLGMRPKDVFTFMSSTDFSKFFDPVSDTIPTPGGPYDHSPSAEASSRRRTNNLWTMLVAPLGIADWLRQAVKGAGPAVKEGLLTNLYRMQDLVYAMSVLGGGRFGQPGPIGAPGRSRPRRPSAPPLLTDLVLKQLRDCLPEYLTSLSLDMGIFSGQAARDRLAQLIAERMNVDLDAETSRAGAAGSGHHVTFKMLDDFCAINNYPLLRVTGSELCSLQTVIFSGANTPDFPVADAVRISMGLPFVYKPYTIRSTGQGMPPCGVYVDGGVFSNLPLLAFSDKEAAKAIGLRLEIDMATRIDGFLGLLGQVAKASLLAGESSVTNERAQRTIRLDTLPLGLFDFSTDQATLEKVAARAHYTTMLFFAQGGAFAPVDLRTGEKLPPALEKATTKAIQDDLDASVKRRRAAAGCVFQT